MMYFIVKRCAYELLVLRNLFPQTSQTWQRFGKWCSDKWYNLNKNVVLCQGCDASQLWDLHLFMTLN